MTYHDNGIDFINVSICHKLACVIMWGWLTSVWRRTCQFELLISVSDYQFGIQLNNTLDGKVILTFNARNDHDRQKFVEDLKEAIMEVSGLGFHQQYSFTSCYFCMMISPWNYIIIESGYRKCIWIDSITAIMSFKH